MASKTVEILIKATDAFSKPLGKVDKELRELAKRGAEMQRLGTTLSLAVTAPLTAIGVGAVKAFSDSAQAMAQVEAGIKSTGGAAKLSADELAKMAEGLQDSSLFDDDEILKKVTANLLTFSDVQGKTFAKAQEAILDLSTRMDQDLQSSAIQVGKALNDPIAGISSLSRVGVQFSEKQKDVIKQLVETGDKAGAQAMILQELNREFQGSAEAASKVGAGPLIQISNQLGNLLEDIGKIILEAIQPFIGYLGDVVRWFKDLDEPTKKWGVAIAAVFAALGPALAIGGTLLTWFASVAAAIAGAGGLTALLGSLAAIITGPVGLTVAISAAVYALWDWFSQTEEGAAALSELWGSIKEAAETIGGAISAFWAAWGDDIKDTFSVLWGAVSGILKAALTTIADALKAGIKVLTGVIQAFHGAMTGDWKKFSDGIAKIWKGLWDLIVSTVTAPINAVKGAVKGLGDDVTAVFASMYDKIVGHSYVPDMMKRIQQEFGKLNSIMVRPAQNSVSSVLSSFSSLKGIGDLVGNIVGIPGLGSLVSTAVSGVGAVAGLLKSDTNTPLFAQYKANPSLDFALSAIAQLEQQKAGARGFGLYQLPLINTDLEFFRGEVARLGAGSGLSASTPSTMSASPWFYDPMTAAGQMVANVYLDGRMIAQAIADAVDHGGARMPATELR